MRFVFALNEICIGRGNKCIDEKGGWWKELNVEWKGMDLFHVRKGLELR